MKILLINKFLYMKGGDAVSTIATGNLLRNHGHQVSFWGMEHPKNPPYPYRHLFIPYLDFNQPGGAVHQLSLAFNILYSMEAKRKIRKLIEIDKPDIVHLNNFAHQISPSILDVFDEHRIPVVMTMRDYKLVCPSYSMLGPDGKQCEKCKNGKFYWCFLTKCVKGSYAKSLLNTLEMYFHRSIHIYDKIDIFISPSEFLKKKVKEMGFKKEVVCLPNFIEINEFIPQFAPRGNRFVYFGRLSREKGIFTLIEAMKGLKCDLAIIGEGPIKGSLMAKVEKEGLDNICFPGYKTGVNLHAEIKNSIAAILPSEWYENNPRTVMESFALGKPVIGSRIGGIPELVIDGETGLTYNPGDAGDLRSKIELLLGDAALVIKMGKRARKFVEDNLNPGKHYNELIEVYQQAMEKSNWKRR